MVARILCAGLAAAHGSTSQHISRADPIHHLRRISRPFRRHRTTPHAHRLPNRTIARQPNRRRERRAGQDGASAESLSRGTAIRVRPSPFAEPFARDLTTRNRAGEESACFMEDGRRFSLAERFPRGSQAFPGEDKTVLWDTKTFLRIARAFFCLTISILGDDHSCRFPAQRFFCYAKSFPRDGKNFLGSDDAFLGVLVTSPWIC